MNSKPPPLVPPPPSPAASKNKSSSPKIPPPTTPHATFAGSAARKSSTSGPSGTISRSISACNRCRARKTKCDQLFPSCTACLRASVECVGIDAATGREIPRSYVDWLEKRVKHLEEQLKLQSLDSDTKEEPQFPRVKQDYDPPATIVKPEPKPGEDNGASSNNAEDKALRLRPDIENLVNQVGVVGVQGTSATGFLGGSSGISFARLMFAAVKIQSKDGPSATRSSAPARTSQQPLPTPDSVPRPDPNLTSVIVPRNRQHINPIPFPPRREAEQLMEIYFQQANPQFPILHKPTFEPVFRRVCDRVAQGGAVAQGMRRWTDDTDRIRHSADLYFANMCFAIAAAMSTSTDNLPERYYATAEPHMESLFSAISRTNNRLDGLKGMLLLAVYSLMRPVAPGVWYVLGAALRLAVDLGLHQENPSKVEKLWDPLKLDERRRLFWCTYSLDRQVCVYLGRPFGISDDAVKTPFPLDVSDECITPTGIHPERPGRRSSRTISLHMFRIRQLQSEINRILYQTSQIPRKFQTLEDWRRDMERRLQEWWDSAPKSQAESGCGYNLSFVDLNYLQTKLLLYGLSPAIPVPSVQSYEIIADTGSRIIRTYRHLHLEQSINYTWLACHNLFMAGTSYLCALWQCPRVRATTEIEQIDHNTLACVDVLSSMIDRCPAAQTCRDVFESLASATVKLCRSDQYTAVKTDGPVPAVTAQQHPTKRIKTDVAPSDAPILWTPNPSEAYSPASALPVSLANIVHHHPAPPPTPPTPHDNPYVPAVSGAASGFDPNGFAHQNIDPTFRAQAGLSPFLQMGGSEIHPMVDGSRLFEMIQEVGQAGGLGWDPNMAPIAMAPTGGPGWTGTYDGWPVTGTTGAEI